MLFIMFNDFENFIVIKGNDKEEYAKDAVTGKRVHGLKDRLTGSLRKVALEPDIRSQCSICIGQKQRSL